MPREKREIEGGLQRKGFRRDDKEHRIFWYFTLNGKRSRVKTWTSHSPKMKTVDNSLLSKMAKQCKLDKDQFLKLVDCPLEQREYEEMRAIGLVE